MADPKDKGGKKDDKKKDDKKPESSGGVWTEFAPLLWLLGVPIFLGLFLTNWNGVFFNWNSEPVKDPETGEIVNIERTIGFPAGKIVENIEVVNTENTLVRNAPAGTPFGEQEKYIISKVVEGPIVAYGERWWRLNYEKAPSGWVAENSITSYVWLYRTVNIFPISWKYLKPVLWFLDIVLIIMILYVGSALKSAQEIANKKIQSKPNTIPHIVVDTPQTERESNTRWMHVIQLLESYNVNDWRQAIIESDIILEEMLEKMGYDGVSIGDKLKNVEPSDFLTINQAWEAHKTRNKIAHMGSEYKVTQSEARKVIGLYQEVFEEFYFI